MVPTMIESLTGIAICFHTVKYSLSMKENKNEELAYGSEFFTNWSIQFSKVGSAFHSPDGVDKMSSTT